MQNRTYSDLLSLIKGLIGVGRLTTNETLSILNFVNRRANQAYLTSQSWPRYLVVGEERSIETSPAQTILYAESGLDTIYEFIRIHKTQPFLRLSAREFDFYVDSVGAHIRSLSTDTTTAFVTYKKELSQFTDNSTDIPGEWFNFLAHATYADFLRLDSQQSKAMAEESIAQNYLALELQRVDNISNNNSVLNKITTHGSSQSR